MDSQIKLRMDDPPWNGARFYRDGKLVPTEAALREGFFVEASDAPCIVTLADKFIRTREENSL